MSGFDFMKNLAIIVMKKHKQKRLRIPNLPQETKQIILLTLGNQQHGEKSLSKKWYITEPRELFILPFPKTGWQVRSV